MLPVRNELNLRVVFKWGVAETLKRKKTRYWAGSPRPAIES